MKKPALLVFVILSYCSVSNAQVQFNIQNTTSNLYNGFRSAVSWYDIPIGAAYLYRNSIRFGNGIPIKLNELDEEISEGVSHKGTVSLGSMNKDIIPRTIFFSRLAVTTSLNLLTNAHITENEYRKIFLFDKSLIYTYTATEIIKNVFNRTRPDGSDNRSFISGHTSTAFAASTFLSLELNDFYNDWSVTRNNGFLKTGFKAVSFSILYGWAGYVGYSRIHDDKHYFTDVVGGAAVGTLISYFIYKLNVAHGSSVFDQININTSGRSAQLSFAYQF